MSLAQQNFGSPDDYKGIAAAIAQTRRGSELILDFTPFERIGKPQNIQRLLGELVGNRRVTFLATVGSVPSLLKDAGLLLGSGLVLFNEHGERVGPTKRNGDRVITNALVVGDQRASAGSLQELHRLDAARRIADLARPYVLQASQLDPRYRERASGRWFIRLPNGMLATHWIDTKRLFASPASLFEVSYEVARHLFNSFCRAGANSPDCDLIVATSNNSLVVAGAVHAITGIQLCVIDKIGPVPSQHLTAMNTSLDFRDRRVAMIVEVSSTGSEIDRTIQFLDNQKARIARVVCCFAWNAAQPRLCKPELLTHLWEPPQRLGYVYRSA